jgi:chorismate mutase
MNNKDFDNENLQKQRERINLVDNEIIKLLDERFTYVEIISEIKKKAGMPILNQNREQEILNKIEKLSKHPKQAKEIFRKIMEESRNLQE